MTCECFRKVLHPGLFRVGLFCLLSPPSPIMEETPSEEKLLLSASTHGTIVCEGLAPPTSGRASSSITVAPPPAVLSFRDHTLCPANASIQRTAYPSPRPDPQSPAKPGGAVPFAIMEDLEPPGSPGVRGPAQDVPMSPGGGPRLDWLSITSPEPAAEPDLEAFLSPRPPRRPHAAGRPQDGPMSPDVPMSLAPQPPSDTLDEPMTSPVRGEGPSVSTAQSESAPLVSDPWDARLISGLLSELRPPLTSHPHCISWQGNVPNICPRATIRMGENLSVCLSLCFCSIYTHRETESKYLF